MKAFHSTLKPPRRVLMKLNKLIRAFTFEGAKGKRFTPEAEL